MHKALRATTRRQYCSQTSQAAHLHEESGDGPCRSERQNADHLAFAAAGAFEGHDLRLLSALHAVVFPLKRDLSVLHIERPLVGKSHPVGVAAEISEYLSRTSKGRPC